MGDQLSFETMPKPRRRKIIASVPEWVAVVLEDEAREHGRTVGTYLGDLATVYVGNKTGASL